MWLSFAPESRLIIDFVLGPRKQYVADALIEATDKHLSDSSTFFVTDGLKLYIEALLKKYGKRIEFPKTGKRGRPKNPAIVPDENLKYAQVIKKRKEGKLYKVEKRVIFGQDINESKISTSLLERQNLTLRQDNNRVSRKTIGFSKKIKGLYYQVRLYCTYSNFCREHEGLTKEDEKSAKYKTTPSQECGITRKKWTLTELLNYRPLKTSTEL